MAGRTTRRGLAVLFLAAAGACSAGEPAGDRVDRAGPGSASPTATPAPTPVPTRAPTASGSTTPTPTPAPTFDARAALATVRALAGDIGPREATTRSYRRAVELVRRRLEALGYDVRLQGLRVPAGRSWGIAVPAGETANVIAHPARFDPRRAHVVLGAHLDTVPQAPGAVDDASGVAVVIEVARLAAAAPTAVPVVFVAFAAEEPRGGGDDGHHYGSRAYVARLADAQRDGLLGAIAVDSVGIAARVPVCTGGRGPTTLADRLLARARQLGIPTRRCDNRASDHWSFERAGLVGVRVGEAGLDAYPQYHSPADRPGIVDARRLGSAGRLVWETLRTLRPR